MNICDIDSIAVGGRLEGRLGSVTGARAKLFDPCVDRPRLFQRHALHQHGLRNLLSTVPAALQLAMTLCMLKAAEYH